MKTWKNALQNRWTTTWCALLVVQAVLGQPSTAYTQSQNCELFPFAPSWNSVSNLATGAMLNNLTEDSGFAWLSWSGQTGKKPFIRSITGSGSVHEYENPDDPTDRVLNASNWVKAASAINAKDVRNALDDLIGQDVVVPVWKQKRGSGSSTAYRICKYARVRLTGYDLARGRVSLRFLGLITCESANQPPVVYAGDDLGILYANPASLRGAVSDDGLPQGRGLSVGWVKISGPGNVTFANPASPETTAHFTAVGQYVLRLTANDSELTSADDLVVNVENPNRPPLAASQSVTTSEDAAVAITLGASDPDGDSLTFTLVSTPRFGALSGTPPNLIYTPRANFAGTDSFQFLVSDGALQSAPADVTLSVSAVNDAPLAHAQTVSGNEDSALSVTLTGSDIEGTPLSFTVLQPPARGTLSGSGAQLTYMPAPNFEGWDQFTFAASDGALQSPPATISLNLRAVNDAPVALAQTAALDEDGRVDLVLLAQDVDGDALNYELVASPAHGTLSGTLPDVRYTPAANYHGSDSFSFRVRDAALASAPANVDLTVRPVNDSPAAANLSANLDEDGQLPIVLSGTDVDGDALTFTIVGSPQHGSLSGTPPNLTYTPAENYNGADQFTFTVSDGAVTSGAATVSLNVQAVNDSPVAVDATATFAEDGTLDLVLTATDVDNDALSFEVTAAPAHGILSGAPPNLRYTPAANFHGSDSFTFVARDGSSLSAPATVGLTVTPVNDPPVASGQSLTLDEDGQVAVVLSGTDVDGDALTYAITRSPANGVLSGTPPNLTYTPAANYSGSDSFQFVIDDGALNSSAIVSVSVLPVNDAPVGSAQAVSLLEDENINILLSANDVENSPLTFSVLTPPQYGVLSGQAPNLVYTPIANYYGFDDFTFLANDGELDSAPTTVAISVTPVNDPPVAHPQTIAAVEGQDLRITLTANDVDGDPLQFTIVTRPHLGTVSGVAPDLTYHAPVGVYGTDYLEFTVSDGALSSAARIEIPVLRRVEAGPNQFVRSTSDPVTLNGIVRDNGLPAQILWQKKVGPGVVTFADASSPATTATFTSNGIYLLELVATDTARAARDTVEVRVGALCTEEAPAGMVAWWQASFDSRDYVSGDAAQLQQGAGFDAGKVGAAFRFDGLDDRIMVPATTALDVGQGAGFTIEFWMNSADSARTARLLAWHSGAGTRASSTNWGVNVFQSSGNLYAQFYDVAGTPRDVTAFNSVVNNTWMHVAVTYDRATGQGRIFLNGVLRVSAQVGSFLPRTSYDLYLGQVPVETLWYRGLLDEVSIYDRPLDQQAVYNIFAAGEVGKCRANGNQAPRVNAGYDVVLRDTTGVATLSGEVTDSTLPGGPVRVQWSTVSGPGIVSFADPTAPATTAAFSGPGIYVLRLTADDAEYAISDVTEVRVGTLCTVAEVPGLVAWWTANGDASDVVAGRHGRIAGGTTFDTGKVSTAFRFDGTNDIVQIPAHPTLDLGTGIGLTIEFWMNSADVSRLARLISWHSGLALGGANTGLNIYQQSGNLYAQFNDITGSPREITLFTALANNTWVHVAVTYDRAAGHARIFLNGVLRLTANLGNITPRTTHNIYFGNQPFDGGYYRGLLDEISFYSRALDAQEVYEIYVSNGSGKCPLSNQGPLVNAGPDLELASVSDSATLNGFVTDDGLPPGMPVTVLWTKLEGPGTVTFEDAASPATTATFSAAGIYVLKLTADDGAVVRSDVAEVRVANACTVSPADLVAWFPGNGSADELVNGRTGRLAGGATFASGKVASAFSFDGLNDSVHIPAHSALDLGAGQGFTIEFWMNSSDVQRNARLLGWHTTVPGSATNFGVNVYQYNGNLYAQVYDQAGNPREMVVFFTLTNNVWAHVGVTYDRALGQGRIYINGMLRVTANLGSYRPQTTYGLFFGNLQHEPSYYRGLLDEVAFYSRALPISEIQSIYTAGSGGRCHLAPTRFTSQESGGYQTVATFTVNESGQRTRAQDRSGVTDYHYDADGRLASLTKTWNAVAGYPAFTTSVSYEYDDLSRVTQVRSSNDNGVDIRYGYGADGLLAEVFDPHSGRSQYVADDQGQLVCVYPNGQTAYAYAPSGAPEASDADVLDVDGNVVLRTTGSTVTYYLIDPLSLSGAARVVEELTMDATLAAPSVTRVYTYGYHLISVDELMDGDWRLTFTP